MLKAARFCLGMLLIGVYGTTTAQENRFRDWYYGVTNTGNAIFAATINDSGNLLGKYCYPNDDACIYLLGMRTSYKEGNSYPVLVNSNKGALQLHILCNGRVQNNLYEYVFTEFSKIDDIVLNAYRVGFAVPLANDQFTVARFSLIGSNEAIAKLEEASARLTAPRRSGTRDQRL